LGVPHCRGKGGWKSLGRTLLKVNGGGGSLPILPEAAFPGDRRERWPEAEEEV
jgi:hypothetical protein